MSWWAAAARRVRPQRVVGAGGPTGAAQVPLPRTAASTALPASAFFFFPFLGPHGPIGYSVTKPGRENFWAGRRTNQAPKTPSGAYQILVLPRLEINEFCAVLIYFFLTLIEFTE